MPSPGDKVKIISKKRTEEGILMPSPDQQAVIIKLDNGYNMGFKKDDVTKIETVEKSKEVKPIKEKIVKDESLPTIAVLHTGGTIASKVDYETGAVTAKFTAEDLLEMFPELRERANIETELVANMMSEDMVFSDYQKVAAAVKKYADMNVKGIIIGHGTDTLAFTAAALAFMFEKINLPVLIVGSQRSSDRGSTDAAQNLICVAEFIAKTKFTGIAICMHHASSDEMCAILPATKTRKMHTSRRDAFKAVNDQPIALIDYNTQEIDFLQDYNKKSKEDNKIIMKEKFSDKVGLLKTHPNMNPALFEFFTENYQAIVIEATGLGHTPTNLGDNLKNYEALKKFIKKGGIVAITSQCLFGRVHPSVYTNLRRLSEIGCIFCEDMLPETAFIKLSWLLGNYSPEETHELLAKNLRGEINESLSYEEEFIEK